MDKEKKDNEGMWLKPVLEDTQDSGILPNREGSLVGDSIIHAQHPLENLDLDIAHVATSNSSTPGAGIIPFTHESLPMEVLAEIFVFALSDGDVFLIHDSSEEPWTYLCVCSRWRRVALGEHRLWDTLIAHGSLNSTGEWLNHLWSQNTTSSVALYLENLENKARFRDFSGTSHSIDIYNLISQYSSRISVLRVEDLDYILFKLISHPPLPFERLESVTLKWNEHSHPGRLSTTLFTNAASLRRLEINGLEYERFAEPSLDFPLSNLTSLTLIDFSPPLTTLHSMLSQCSQLIQFTFGIASSVSPSDLLTMKSLPKINLPMLRDLTLALGVHGKMQGFFQWLFMPSLKNIVIRPTGTGPTTEIFSSFPRDEFLAMLTKSTAIETISLNCDFIHLYPSDLETILRGTPHLTKLLLPYGPDLPHTVFDMMRSGELLPNLFHLRGSTTSVHALLDLFEHQCSVAELQEYRGLSIVHITYRRNRDQKRVYERFQALEPRLRHIGKDIKLRSMGGNYFIFEGPDPDGDNWQQYWD